MEDRWGGEEEGERVGERVGAGEVLWRRYVYLNPNACASYVSV